MNLKLKKTSRRADMLERLQIIQGHSHTSLEISHLTLKFFRCLCMHGLRNLEKRFVGILFLPKRFKLCLSTQVIDRQRSQITSGLPNATLATKARALYIHRFDQWAKDAIGYPSWAGQSFAETRSICSIIPLARSCTLHGYVEHSFACKFKQI